MFLTQLSIFFYIFAVEVELKPIKINEIDNA